MVDTPVVALETEKGGPSSVRKEPNWQLQRIFASSSKPTELPYPLSVPQEATDRDDGNVNLYGRGEEQRQLCDAFRRRNRESADLLPELVLVTGASGNGKTALITATLSKEIESQKGFFLRGKFDLLERTEAYYPLVRAFSDFVQRLLAGDEGELSRIRQELIPVTPLQPLLVEMIPALEVLFDAPKVPSARDVKAAGAQKRLHFAFGQFLRALCSPTRPLGLFLDDLQWAQPASVDLVAFLVEENIPGLFLVGACRGQEVALEHHLSVTLRELEANSIHIETIVLGSLRNTAVAAMISDISGTSSNSQVPETLSLALADIVLEKTNGITLIVIEVLQALSADGFFSINGNSSDEVMKRVSSRLSGSLDLIEDKIQRMSRHVQQVLMLAACLGAEFEEDLLRRLVSFDINESLIMASNRGLIHPDRISGTWRFAHDQIQQATYSLIPEDEKELAHLTIGRKLWSTLSPEQLEAHFFLVVNQLSFGVRLMTDKEERAQFAALLILAGQKAAQSFTFSTASSHLELGISLLEDRHWRDQYELSMELYHAAAESEYCNGNYERTDVLVEEILRNARSDNEKIGALTIRIYSLGSRNEMSKAINLGLKVLRDFGFKTPANSSIVAVLFELAKTKRLLRKYSDEDILRLPVMTDERQLAAMRIILIIFAYAIHLKPMVAAILVMRLVQLSLQTGCSGMSAVGFCSLAMLLCNGFGEVKLGIRLARLSIVMLDKFESREWLPRIYSACYGLCFTYCDPWRNSLKPLLMAHRVGLVSGDIEFSALAGAMHAGVGLNSSLPLSLLCDECTAFLQMMKQHNQTNMMQFILPSLQFARCLMGDCDDPSVLAGDVMRRSQALQDATSTNNRTIVAYIHWNQMILSSLFYDYDTALRLARTLAEDCDCSNFACFNRASWYLHEALAALSLPGAPRRWRRRVARANLRRLRAFLAYSEPNFAPHVQILEAEMDLLQDRLPQALARFDEAVRRAAAEQMWQQAALGHERAARALAQGGRAAEARDRLAAAMGMYERWGAHAKVAHLRAQLLPETSPR